MTFGVDHNGKDYLYPCKQEHPYTILEGFMDRILARLGLPLLIATSMMLLLLI
jgi:hypothetical protein